MVFLFISSSVYPGSWPLGWVLCEFWISLDVLLCTASILSLCAISIDRWVRDLHLRGWRKLFESVAPRFLYLDRYFNLSLTPLITKTNAGGIIRRSGRQWHTMPLGEHFIAQPKKRRASAMTSITCLTLKGKSSLWLKDVVGRLRALEISVCCEIWIQWKIIYCALAESCCCSWYLHGTNGNDAEDKGEDWRTEWSCSKWFMMWRQDSKNLI